MSEEVYLQLLRYIEDNKGWTYIGNKQPLIAVKDLKEYIKCIYNEEV